MKKGIKAPQDPLWSVWDVKEMIIVGSERNVLES